ncbi:hypothetical protein FQN49_005440 [Arthroderma sp. PD_2]|nr:hypothetical protein FQN49_005440 [Arthroderma sp. PD_2]
MLPEDVLLYPPSSLCLSSGLCYAVPLLTSTSQFCKRLRWVHGATEVDGIAFLGEGDIINGDFQCGGPHLANLPAITSLCTDMPFDAETSKLLVKRTREIMDKWNVKWWNIQCVRRIPQDQWYTYYDTILVYADRDVPDMSWFNACKEVLAFIAKENFSLNIEIIDQRGNGRPTLSEVFPGDPLVTEWGSLRQGILQAFPLLIRHHICAVELSTPPNNHVSTIAISVVEDYYHDYNWLSVREHIVDMLDDRDLYHVAMSLLR